jgi:hypothetical protein
MSKEIKTGLMVLIVFICSMQNSTPGQDWYAKVAIDWDKQERVSTTAPTYQIVGSPLLLPNSPVHDQTYHALRDLQAEYALFGAWYVFPKLGVAELDPPRDGKTYWDFSSMDPMVIDFIKATQGHKIIMDLSTIPEWMFKTSGPVSYPADPNQTDYTYEQGTELRDLSMTEVADYFARLASWYTKGGLKDEYGQWHPSGHYFKIDCWQVLNEVDFEHGMTPEGYTGLYDAIVTSIRRVDPDMKFVGPAIGVSPVPVGWDQSRFFEYFLNHANHKPGIPIDMISYHVYATPGSDESAYVQQFTVFEETDAFLHLIKYIDLIRQRLSPQTQTIVAEIGTILDESQPIPDSYWNLSAAMYGYIYNQLSHAGVQAAGMSSMLDYPTFFPSVTMLDWNSGKPNARYWALKLLIENAGPGDKQVETEINLPFLDAQAYVTPAGKRKILLVNKRDRPFEVSIPGVKGSVEQYVDVTTNFNPPSTRTLDSDHLTLQGYTVGIITLEH